MIDVRNLKKFDRITIKEEGDMYNQIGIVTFTDGNIAEICTIKYPEHPYTIGIWNANKMDMYLGN